MKIILNRITLDILFPLYTIHSPLLTIVIKIKNENVLQIRFLKQSEV